MVITWHAGWVNIHKIIHQKLYIIHNTLYIKNMNKIELVQKILHFVITILTAIATTLGTTSCIGAM